ncbi:hypothetical protein PanWU01x14_270400 [Parasponia andersonii]|uniref:Uncharacterized protein n=1 Tax=Parasponia andersonii TaxID=3476 RepID=A0A2P5B558_PARAD|nr:hypothetical protein PanWU01x14_270400 [Parasponia andersonii]
MILNISQLPEWFAPSSFSSNTASSARPSLQETSPPHTEPLVHSTPPLSTTLDDPTKPPLFSNVRRKPSVLFLFASIFSFATPTRYRTYSEDTIIFWVFPNGSSKRIEHRIAIITRLLALVIPDSLNPEAIAMETKD